METTPITADFEAAVDRELSLDSHDFSSLNGQASDVKKYINPKPFSDEKALVDHFAVNGKGKYGMFFSNIKSEDDKKILLHLVEDKIVAYIDNDMKKSGLSRENIIQQAKKSLFDIDQAKEKAKQLKTLKETAEKVIASSEKVMAKLGDTDTSEIEKKIAKLRSLIKKDHPEVEELQNLITQVSDESANLIGNEKKATAIKYAGSVMEKIQNVLSKDDTPADVKPYFLGKRSQLETLIKKEDVLALEDITATIDKELVEATDPTIRAKKRSLQAISRNMLRIMLMQIFPTNKLVKYSEIISEICKNMLSTNYDHYLANRGRITMKLPPLETFINAERAALSIAVGEMVLVHKGNNDIESVIDRMNYDIFSLPNLDTELRRVQEHMLSIDDLSEKPRLTAITALLSKIKAAYTNEAKDQYGFTDNEADDLVKGDLFSEALEMIPYELCSKFEEEETKKPRV